MDSVNYKLYLNILAFIKFRTKEDLHELKQDQIKDAMTHRKYIIVGTKSIIVILYDYDSPCSIGVFRDFIDREIVTKQQVVNKLSDKAAELLVCVELKDHPTNQAKFTKYVVDELSAKTKTMPGVFVVDHSFFAMNALKRPECPALKKLTDADIEFRKEFYQRPNYLDEIPRVKEIDVDVRWYGMRRGDIITITSISMNAIQYEEDRKVL